MRQYRSYGPCALHVLVCARVPSPVCVSRLRPRCADWPLFPKCGPPTKWPTFAFRRHPQPKIVPRSYAFGLSSRNLVWYPRHRSNAQRTCSARPRAPLLPLLMVLFYTFYRYGPELGRVRFACVSCPRLRFSNEPDLQSVVSTVHVHVFMFVRFLCLSRVRPGSHRCLFTVCARVSRVCPGSLRCLFTGTGKSGTVHVKSRVSRDDRFNTRRILA